MIQVFEGDGQDPEALLMVWGILRRDQDLVLGNQYLAEYEPGEAMSWYPYESEDCDKLAMTYARDYAEDVMKSLQERALDGRVNWHYWLRRVR